MHFGTYSLIPHRVMALCLLSISIFLSLWAVPSTAQQVADSQIQFQSNAYRGIEGNVIEVVLERVAFGSVPVIGAAQAVVNVGTGGAATVSDDTNFNGPSTINWAASDTEPKTISIRLTDDLVPEGNEDFFLQIEQVTGDADRGSPLFANVTIVDSNPGELRFIGQPYRVVEGESIDIQIERFGGSDGQVNVFMSDDNGTAGDADYERSSPSSQLNWNDGELGIRTITYSTFSDAEQEADETFQLLNIDGFRNDGPGIATVTIIDDVPSFPGELQFTSSVYSSSEAGGPLTLTVERIDGMDGAATVDYTISPNTALQGSDFTGPLTGQLSWADDNADNLRIVIPLVDDAVNEPLESLDVELTNSSGALIGSMSFAVGEIVDDDPLLPGVVDFDMSVYNVGEPDGSVILTVQRTGGSDGDVSVDVQLAEFTATFPDDGSFPGDEDFVTLDWPAGDSSPRTIMLIVNSDTDASEGQERFDVSFGGPTGGLTIGTSNPTASIFIDDGPPPGTPGEIAFNPTMVTVDEDAGSVSLTVTRINGSLGEVSVGYSVAPGSGVNIATPGVDFGTTPPPTGTLSWPDGDATSRTIILDIVNDSVPEPDELFTLVLSNASGGAFVDSGDQVEVTIIDVTPPPIDEVRFAMASDAVQEDVGMFDIVVQRVGTGNGDVEVFYDLVSGTATLGTDFEGPSSSGAGTLVWLDGDLTDKTIPVTVILDAESEDDEQFTAVLSNGFTASTARASSAPANVGTPRVMTITILEAPPATDVVRFVLANDSVLETDGTIDIVAERIGQGIGDVSVSYELIDGTAQRGQDYDVAGGLSSPMSFFWPAGDLTNKTLTIEIDEDALIEGAETFSIQLSTGSGSGNIDLGIPNQTVITIGDSPPPMRGNVQFNPETYTVSEPDGSVDLTVTRTGGSDGLFSVGYEVLGGTAILGTDHAVSQPSTGTLTWPDTDDTPRTITVDIASDSLIEPDENFSVTLFQDSDSGSFIIDMATVVIVDSTAPDSIALADAAVETDENAGVLSLTVRRSGTGIDAVSILYSLMDGTAEAGTDYAITQPTAGTVSWAAGDLADKTIEIDIANDAAQDPNETFLVNLALDPVSPIITLGSPAQTTVTIIDVAPPNPGVVEFDPDEYTVAEVDGEVTLQITRTGGNNGPASAQFEVIAGTAIPGEDVALIEPLTGVLNWPAGDDTPRTINIDIATDDDVEGEESFSVMLSGITGAAAGAATTALVNLMDSTEPTPDTVVMADASVSVAENAGSVDVVVQRVGSGLDAVSVAYTVFDDTATSGVDFSAGDSAGRIVSWAIGDTADKTISIDLIDDALVELDETFSITISPVASSASILIGTPDSTIVTIEDTSPAPVPDVIALAEAEQSRLESEAAFVVVISRTGDGSGASSVSWTVSPGSASVAADIELDPLTGSVSWEDGDIGDRTVRIPIVDDTVDEVNETLNFTLSQVAGAVLGSPQTAMLTINDNDEPPEPGTVQFVTDSYAVDEDAGVVTLELTRTNGDDGLISVVATTVPGSAGANDFSTTQTVIDWPDGFSGTRQLVVPITFDSVTEPSESFAVVLGNASPDDGILGNPSTATVVINDVFNGNPGTVQFASAALSVNESDSAVTVSVTRTGGSDGTLSVNYSTNAGSAASGDDFEATSGTLTWADGDGAPKTFSVAIVADAVSESDEQFTAVLTDVVSLGDASIGSPDTVQITINNVEPPPEPEPELQPGTVQFVSATATVDESDGTVSVSVARTGGTDGAVSVRYETVDGSAEAGVDFDSVSGRLQWDDGENDVRILRIAIDVDALVEADEQFQVLLSDARPRQQVLGSPSTVDVTIRDDSVAPPGVLAFTTTSVTVAEADGSVELQVSRTEGSAGAVSVGYSTLVSSADEADFQAASGQLNWTDGDTSLRTIIVPVNRDGLVEPDEQFQVVLAQSEPFGDSQQLGAAVATVSIIDSTRLGTLSFVTTELSVTERVGSITLSVSRSGGADGEVSVDYALIGGSAELGLDVVDQNGTLSWADLDAEPKTIRVLVNQDNTVEDAEQFIVALSNAQPLGAQQIELAQATVTIIDTTLPADESTPALASLGELDLVVVSGDGQSGLPGDLLEPLVIDVIDRGASDATIADVPILWRAVPEGSAELLESRRTVSDDDGRTNNRIRILSRGFVRIVASIDVQVPTASSSMLAARNNPPPFPVSQAEAVFTVRSGIGPAEGLGTNQAAIGTTLDAVCEILDVRIEQQLAITVEQQDLFDTCQEVEARLVNDNGLGAALDRLIPEEMFFLGDSIIDTTDIQITNVYARINAIRSGQVDIVELSGLQFNHYDQSIPGSVIEAAQDELYAGGAASADDSLSGMTALGFFATGSISYGEFEGGENQSDAEFRSTGLTLGADYRATENTVFGVGIGIVDNDTDFNPDAGSAQVSGLNLTVFGTYYRPQKGYIDAVLDFGRNDIDIERRINLPNAPDQFGVGETTANVRSLTIGAGRDYRHNGWEFGPYGRLSIIDADIDGFSERATGSADGFGSVLTIGSHSVQSRRLALGGQVSRTVSTKRAVFIPQFRIEAEFESENRKEGIEATFQHDPTQTPFIVNGDERDSSYFNLGIGSSVLLPNGRSGFLFYETQQGNERVTQHWLKLGIRLEF